MNLINLNSPGDGLLCDQPWQCGHAPGGQVPPVLVHEAVVPGAVLVQQRVLVQVYHLADVDTSLDNDTTMNVTMIWGIYNLDRLAMILNLFGEGSQQKVTLIVKHYQLMF